MKESITVLAPATVANIGCGFDIFGLALHQPSDKIRMTKTGTKSLSLSNQTLFTIPLNPLKNTATVAVQALLDDLGSEQGFEIEILEKIKPGSGLGSSSASAAAAVYGANILLGEPYTKKNLVQFAMEGERAASNVAHADNVAPALLGGVVLIRSYSPLDVIQLNYPKNIYCSVVHPQIEVKTEEARKILPQNVPLRQAVKQWGNVAALVAGFAQSDFELIGRSLDDFIIEPVRSALIPHYNIAKQAAIKTGALGVGISGSGPTLFALSKDQSTAQRVAVAMKEVFDGESVENKMYVSLINSEGVRVE
jgi:homoserine kinase